MPFDQVANRLRDCGREENRLPFLGRCGKDFFDVFAEAHVEHAVGLIEDNHLDRAEPKRAFIHVIHDSARCSNHNLNAFFEFEKLTLIGCSAIDGHGV